jgi:hypothetical protein
MISDQEIIAYCKLKGIRAGGYYSAAVPTQAQSSSFFGGIENFLVELLEFFLFLAMLSYVVGYEEWLPWEEEEPDDE